MLPLVGILALGLLVLGVRLLFVTPGSDATYPEPSIQTTSEPTVADQNTPPIPQDEPSAGQIVAVPVQDVQEKVVIPPSSAQTAPKTKSPAPKPLTGNKPAPPVSASPGVWVVQIGAFTTRDAAEALAREARGKSYEAFVVKAEVGGKTYFRVRVGAGSPRGDAESLASDLAAKGYPTQLARKE